jgi:CheY-like chemotaxis protein
MAVEGIRVLVAGDIYVNPSLVRPFLEDDGYEVVAEPPTREEMLPAVSRHQPDIVVIDDRLLSSRRNGKLIQRVRRAAPDAKVVVFNTGAERSNGSAGADAYLEIGTSLAALSLVLGRLFAEDGSQVAPAVAGVGAASVATSVPRSRESNGGATRFVVTVGAPLLVVGMIFVMLTTSGTRLPRADTTDLADQVVIVPQGTTPLDDARVSLDRLLDAVEAGNYPLAAVYARDLMEQRELAIAGGFLTAELDDQIEVALARVASSLPGSATVSLQSILGNLFPALQDVETPGGGSDVIFAPIIGSSGGTEATVTGVGGADTGVNEGNGNGSGGGDGGTVISLGPGDGRAWGQSHKHTKGEDGPPPWANGHIGATRGHRGDPPGHHDDHGNGHGYGRRAGSAGGAAAPGG